MSGGWTRVKWTEAGQVTAILGWKAAAGDPSPGQPPRAYFDALRAAGRDADAVEFLSQALPRWEAVAWAARSVRDLSSPGDEADARALKAVSATPGTFTGDCAHCQAWAVALLHHAEAPEGILYPSARHKGGVCLALFGARTDCADLDFFDREKAQDSLPIRSLLAREKIGLLR